MKIYHTAAVYALAVAISACSQSNGSKESDIVKSVADNFVGNYFNYDFEKARLFCTDESTLWLKFIASNITQEDIDILRKQPEGASFEAESVDFTNDTTAIAHYRIYNFMRIDTIGKAGKMTDMSNYNITLVKRLGKWAVRMVGPLRSEKQNHD